MEDKFISIGKITNFHGINGEVKVGYTKGKEHQLLGETIFYVKQDTEYKSLTLTNIRFHNQVAIVKFKELNSINDVMEYKGCVIFMKSDSLRKNLQEDEFLVDDLVGLNVYTTDGKYTGKVDCINKQGKADLLSIRNQENKEFLVPFVKALVPEVDLKNKKILINAIEGLIE